jgi:heparanase
MLRKISARLCGSLASALLAAPGCCGALPDAPDITPSGMPRIGTIDTRFQSYNIEMVEVTGGRFWQPYQPEPEAPIPQPRNEFNAPPDMDSNLYQYRPPIDLTKTRLRKLAAALGPAYLRISGTWANSTYFTDSEDALPAPPAGFGGFLTRRQWRNVIDFAQSVDARIVTSFAISTGSRDAAGVWTPDQANRLLRFTRSIGGNIAAAEFMNEPDLAAMGVAPPGYDAHAYGRDFRIFLSFMKQAAPETMIVGHGTVSEGAVASNLIAASASDLDAVSYHFYGTVSQRCHGKATPDGALSEDWLSRTDRTLAFYKTLRDRLAPSKPIWLTETAEAACGGDPWAARFVDVFRYLDQLGRLARSGVGVVMHNTLAASDYGLLDEKTLEPRPNYWAAWLWRQLMGTTVLDAGVPIQSALHVYAHCLRAVSGGVAVQVINTDPVAAHALRLPILSLRYTLDAASLTDSNIRLNGTPLRLGAADALPAITGIATAPDVLTFAPASITFLAIPEAANAACQ